ncbi:hypothetical protein F2Q70_00024729 [Brassica cretica]|uniref:Uncharacterized protein n=1 Tax=Brassica cretica TaxID=69181 RepID=A0A8S9L347_BRACR|nr:hypothetical protein F2Q70_00024729 [Brassica cretica]
MQEGENAYPSPLDGESIVCSLSSHGPGLMLDKLSDPKERDLKRKLEESDAALNQSLWGASSSAEHSQQQQQQGMSSYQANFSMQELVFFRPLQGM